VNLKKETGISAPQSVLMSWQAHKKYYHMNGQVPP